MLKINPENLESLRRLMDGEPRKVVIVGHTNPDGDAIGSMLAWGAIVEGRGHRVSYIVPNQFPSFLAWMDPGHKITVYKTQTSKAAGEIAGAEVIFCMDFNQIGRLEAVGELIEGNTGATKILIDHHLEPPAIYDLAFSYPEASSTSYIVFNLIDKLYGTQAITQPIASAIYVGMMTDTGNFSFGNLTPGLYRALATLAGKKIDIPQIHNNVYNSYSDERMRLLGYVLGEKMQIIKLRQVAYITLTEEEMRQFNFKVGDNEGFVNYPLIIKGMRMSAMFTQNSKFIRVSLRSRGDLDVNLFARRYFDGGGHKNASGGKSHLTMEQTVEKFRAAVEEFFSKDSKYKEQ